MYIKVKVKTEAKKETIKEKVKNSFEISIKQKAERNIANRRILEIISLYLSIPKNKIRIISGHHSSNKILDIKKD